MLRAPTKTNIRINTHSHRARPTDPQAVRAEQFQRAPRNTEIVNNALVINLLRNPERLTSFKGVNLFPNTEIIEGIDGLTLEPSKFPHLKRGDLGCLRSHKKALEYAKEKGYPCVLIFEDDIRFVSDFNKKLEQAMLELPNSWDMLWLAGKDRYASFPYSKLLKINTGMWGAYGYILRNTVYDFFLKEFAKDDNSCDTYYSTFHSKFSSFKTVPDLVIHAGWESTRMQVNKA